jgi:hypothetical protein
VGNSKAEKLDELFERMKHGDTEAFRLLTEFATERTREEQDHSVREDWKRELLEAAGGEKSIAEIAERIKNKKSEYLHIISKMQGPPLKEKIEELFEGLPENPEQRLAAVGGCVEAFREAATKQLQAALNAYLETQTPETYGDKQSIAETVNSHLDRLGLAIGYQGQACNFAATMGGEHPRGRFLLVPKGSKKPLLARVNLADFLPLDLVDAQPRREGLDVWRERVEASRVTGRGAAKED